MDRLNPVPSWIAVGVDISKSSIALAQRPIVSLTMIELRRQAKLLGIPKWRAMDAEELRKAVAWHRECRSNDIDAEQHSAQDDNG